MTGFGRLSVTERLRSRLPAWVALFVLSAPLLLLAACEAPGVPSPYAEAGPATPAADQTPGAPSATPADGGTAAPTPEDGPGGLVFEGRVEIEQSDFKLTPNEYTVKAGEVTFAFTNTGRYTHDFRIEGQGIDEKAPKTGARRSREWAITLEPGTYRISCPISNHDQRGMEGEMIVVE